MTFKRAHKFHRMPVKFYRGFTVRVIVIFSILFSGNVELHAQQGTNASRTTDSIFLADPTIFYEKGVYYLYGTGGSNGFQVYTSTDLRNWKGPVGKHNGYALVKGESFGTTGFWAPQVFRRHDKYYMAYTANENIAIAESESPLGPFKQKRIAAITGNGKQIDPYVFFDGTGKTYLYHVRLTNGNRIYVAEMNSDLSDVIPGTERECIAATERWENTRQVSWPVAEGPTVIKMRNWYYLFYSANDFRNIDYAMGYAVSKSPLGPWNKVAGNPVLSRHNTGANGTGHGDFVKRRKTWYYVFHTHRNNERVSPRATAIVRCRFAKATGGMFRLKVDSSSFYYLRKAD
jgi:xylan 1,4-beta-xylosidase